MPDIIATVDAVILTLEDDALKVLLHRRPREPMQGMLALPGGFIHPDEDQHTDSAMKRILFAKTGVQDIYFEQLATYSGPCRDPRGWSLSVAHLALVPRHLLEVSTDPDIRLVDVDNLPDLAFDHSSILRAALDRLQGKSAYSTLPAAFLPETFTLTQLRQAYEAVLGECLDKVSFRRKMMDLGLIEDTGETSKEGSRRPASLFRLTSGAQTFNRTIAMSG